MLVLSRKRGQSIVLGGGSSGFPLIRLAVVDILGNTIKIGVEAPREVPVHRLEVAERIAAVGG
jgi:carbon storage regulator